MDSNIKLAGFWNIDCYDKDGNKKWTEKIENAVTNEGLNDALNVELAADTQNTSWFIGLINDTAFSALAAADTLASHAGWTEDSNYSGTRPTWTVAQAADQVTTVTNAATVDITMTGGTTLKGMFLASVNTGSAGKLFSTGLFTGGDRALLTSDVLKATYTINATAS